MFLVPLRFQPVIQGSTCQAWGEALQRDLLLEYHTQLWVERAKLRLGHKPELRRERIAAYRAVIASGLRPN